MGGSSSTFHLVAIIICLLGFVSKSFVLDCSTTECGDKFINCPPREDCFVSCSSDQSCLRSIVNCPVTGNCQIQCEGDESCKDMVIDASLLSGNFNLHCDDKSSSQSELTQTSNHCTGIKVYGNTLGTNSGSFEVQCNGHSNACYHSQINCPVTGDCNIQCDGESGCEQMSVGGPQGFELNIACNAQKSCLGAIFNGAKSSKLSLYGCKDYKSCLDVSIYCPAHSTNGLKNCFIQGNDNLGRSKDSRAPTPKPTLVPTRNPTPSPTSPPYIFDGISGGGIKIYAVNGWQDLDIDYSGSSNGASPEGALYCGSDYNMSCDIIWSDRSCNGQCNGIIDLNLNSDEPTRNALEGMNSTAIAPTDIQIDLQGKDKDYGNGYGNDTNLSEIVYNEKLNGDIFILAGLGLVVFVCICVGCAEFRKAMDTSSKNDGNGDHMPAESITPSLREHTYSSKLDKQYSHSERSKKHHAYDQMHHI